MSRLRRDIQAQIRAKFGIPNGVSVDITDFNFESDFESSSDGSDSGDDTSVEPAAPAVPAPLPAAPSLSSLSLNPSLGRSPETKLRRSVVAASTTELRTPAAPGPVSPSVVRHKRSDSDGLGLARARAAAARARREAGPVVVSVMSVSNLVIEFPTRLM